MHKPYLRIILMDDGSVTCHRLMTYAEASNEMANRETGKGMAKSKEVMRGEPGTCVHIYQGLRIIYIDLHVSQLN